MTAHGSSDPAEGDETALLAMLSRVEAGTLAISDDELEQLFRAMSDSRKHVRRIASGALAAALRRGDVRREVAEAWMDGDDEARRWGAAFALHRAGLDGPPMLAVAIASLESVDPDIRWAAASIVIAAARTSETLRTHLRSLTGSAAPTTRRMALVCLCDSGEREPGVYLRALADEEDLMRVAALTSLARIGKASPVVLEAIAAVAHTDAKANVRRAAAAVLRRLG